MATSEASHVKTWGVTVFLYEEGPDTHAHAVLHGEAEPQLQARASAHRAESDLDVPEIGDELAVARALRRLADRLERVADEDIAAVNALSDPRGPSDA